ncbi:MAG: HAD-IA family hydrolase [Sulfitobacter sp.]|nr:HAD-IA family hydrolase [Sulfitobacter sp.]
MKAVFLGSISVLADTSEIQREAFNRAFEEAGLDWHWSQDAYRHMLTDSGGKDRIADYAESEKADIDVHATHARKTEIFQEMLRGGNIPMRPETEKLLASARNHGLKVAFVSGTARESLDALLEGFGGAEALGISLVTSRDNGLAPKPDPALYLYALAQMGLEAADVTAVEDNRPGVDAAKAAGIACLVYPNANTQNHDFGDVDHLAKVDKVIAA